MTMKTTRTTNDAGCSSPHPTEAHQTARGEQPEQDAIRLLLSDDKAFGRAMAYLVAYVRKHAD